MRSLEAAVADYELLLGRRADHPNTLFQLANMRLQLRSSAAGPEGLCELGFAVGDLGRARQLLERRAIPATGDTAARRFSLAAAATHGVPISAIERAIDGSGAEPSPLVLADTRAAVTGLDHVVVRSPNPERAIALYAGRLGLSLRLDRTEPMWGARLLFFRCGDLIIEIAHDLKGGVSDGPDRLWGLSWRVPDVGRAHARLRAQGVAVSEVRAGRRPHTQVFTVKSHTAQVPTSMIGPIAL